MKIVVGNFTSQSQPSFPGDAEMLASMQDNTLMMAILGNIAGDKSIISGCELANGGTERNPGYVFLKTTAYPDGELLYWEGGGISEGIYLKLEDVRVEKKGVVYPKAYTTRTLAAGVGEENYSWADFKDLTNTQVLAAKNAEQDDEIAKLTPPPLGIVQMWAGALNKLPNTYLLCDGAQLRIDEYIDIYNVIGMLHSPAGTPDGYFCLPDLRSRFIVGYNPTDSDYSAIAKKGGAKNVTLTALQSGLPEHVHEFRWGSYSSSGGTAEANRITRGTSNPRTGVKNTELSAAQDAAQAHENRPPYYTLAYVMRVKN